MVNSTEEFNFNLFHFKSLNEGKHDEEMEYDCKNENLKKV